MAEVEWELPVLYFKHHECLTQEYLMNHCNMQIKTLNNEGERISTVIYSSTAK